MSENSNLHDTARLLQTLELPDTAAAYAALLELEQISEQSNALYPLTAQFAEMVQNPKYTVKIRGFRLFCKQARWDTDNLIDENFDAAACILYDPRPTAVRQALAALYEIVKFKPLLRGRVREAIGKIEITKYAHSMSPLLLRDINALKARIDAN